MTFTIEKKKNVEMQKKIGASNLLNKSRLEVLQAQEQHVNNVLETSQQRLRDITKDTAKYSDLLHKLICQGLCQLMEPSVTLRCRQEDLALVEAAAPAANKQYEAMSRKTCDLTIDTNHFLSANLCGGVELVVRNNRIKISNTLEARMDMLAQQMLPEVRTMLFGANPNRKFDN